MKIKGLAHFGLYVNDTKRTLDFYAMLGFEPFYSNVNPGDDGDYKVTFIRNNDCVIEVVEFPHGLKREDGWFDHVALSVEDLDAVVADLKAKNVCFEDDTYMVRNDYFDKGSRWILMRGPDNEHIELNERL